MPQATALDELTLVPEGPLGTALGCDRQPIVFVQSPNHAQSQADAKAVCIGLQGAFEVAGVEIDRSDLNAVALGIGDELGRGIETQRLAVEHRAAENLWVMMLDPARSIHKERKARRMRFGKPILSESAYLVEHRFGKRFIETIGAHAFEKLSSELIDHSGATPSGHGAAKLVGLAGGESRRDDRKPHGLLLEDRDAHGFTKYLSDLLVRIRRLLAGLPSRQIRVDHIPLNGAWPDDGNLDDQVIKTPGPESRKHAHLSSAFDLKDPERIGFADHVVDTRVLGRDRR